MPELLAVLLGGADQIEMAYALIAKFGTLTAMLNASDTEFQEIPGIGPVVAARLKAALELGRRMMTESSEDPVMIKSPGDAACFLMPELMHLEQEHFVVLMLDTRMHLIGKVTLYKGSVNSLSVRTAEVFTEAIRRGASSIMVAHNHPSGDPSPSPEDIAITRVIKEAGEILAIELVDHIIIGRKRFISLRERGLGFS